MIDFENLPMLPLRRQITNDRERLAAASHLKKCAKHRGRNHFHAHQRRKMAKEKAKAMAEKKAKRDAARRAFQAAARKYWSGLRDHHPT